VQASVAPERVCSLMDAALEGLAEALEQASERPLRSLNVLPEAERLQVVEEWNATDAPFPGDSCVHELFEQQAERTPDAVAVVYQEESLTYAQLNARANQLAHHLRGLGVGPDARVGICAERSLEMVVGLLAILKAGGAYVPLDPGYPQERLDHMLRDSAPVAVLTQRGLRERVAAAAGAPVIALDADRAAWRGEPETNPATAELGPDHLAYVIYTSGSTGQPKGVMNHHRCLVNRLAWGRRAWEVGAGDSLLCKTSLGFDGSVRELFLPLVAGARVVLAHPEGHRDPDYLLGIIQRERIGTVNLVPSMLQVLLEHAEVERCAGLKRVLCGGEALPGTLVRRFAERLPGVELHNLYGPSEAATATSMRVSLEGEGPVRVAIGRPMPNTRVYLLDAQGQPVPIGVAGELCIGGAGVARGYLNRPELTAERFVEDPFSAAPGARMYRTGDLARWLADGTIEFLGRNDFQVKIRGFRIELGEIEARLAEHPDVREAVVLAREDAPGEKRLVAYFVGGEAAEIESLRAHLLARLPDYMVPPAYVRLDALPLTPNGKLDRKALPAPEGDAYLARAYEAPRGETEEILAEIWSELLRVERVGRRDSFFDLGGHSLVAVTLIERMRRRGLHAEVRTLFGTPTLAELAAAVRAEAYEVHVPANRIGAMRAHHHAGDAAAGGAAQEQIDAVVAACRAAPPTCRTSTRWRRCRRASSSTT
jgi:amino acid adenylation domain-containing protein